MKLALISAGLFLLSYVAVNGGLGPNPLLLVLPVLIAAGPAIVRGMMGRARRDKPDRARLEEELLNKMSSGHAPLARHVSPGSLPAATPRPSGGKARKLF